MAIYGGGGAGAPGTGGPTRPIAGEADALMYGRQYDPTLDRLGARFMSQFSYDPSVGIATVPGAGTAAPPVIQTLSQATNPPAAQAHRGAVAQAEIAGTRPLMGVPNVQMPVPTTGLWGPAPPDPTAAAQGDARRQAAMRQLASSLGGGGGSRPPSVAPGGFGGAPATPTMGTRRGSPYARGLRQHTSAMAMDKYSPTSGDEILDSELIGGLVGFLI